MYTPLRHARCYGQQERFSEPLKVVIYGHYLLLSLLLGLSIRPAVAAEATLSDRPAANLSELIKLSDASTTHLKQRLAENPASVNLNLLLAARLTQAPDRMLARLEQVPTPGLTPDHAALRTALYCQHGLGAGAPAASQQACEQLDTLLDDTQLNVFTRSELARTRAGIHFSHGDLASTLQRANQAIKYARRSGSIRALSVALNGRATALLRSGLLEAALESFDEARQNLDPVAHQDIVRILAINNGSAQLLAGHPEAALAVYREALSWSQEVSPQFDLAVRANTAEAYVKLQRPGKAVALLEPVLTNGAVEGAAPGAVSHAQLYLAKAYLDLDREGDALLQFARAAQFASEPANAAIRNEVNLAYGIALTRLGREQEAIPLLTRVTEYHRSTGELWKVVDALKAQAKAYAGAGDFDRGYAAQAEVLKLQSTLQTEDFDRQLSFQSAQLASSKEAYAAAMQAQRLREKEIAASLNITRWLSLTLLLILITTLLYLFAARRLQLRTLEAKKLESAELERLVVERTTALENELSTRLLLQDERQQLQAQIAEGEKLRALGQLTSGVAHDFNNLMTVVTLSAELISLENDSMTERQRRALKDILIATESAASITSQLLAYARQQPLIPQPLELREYFNQSTALFQQTLSNVIELRVDVEATWVAVDQANLTTALINLLANAKDAIDGSGTVTLTARRAPPETLPVTLQQDTSSYVLIRVTDSGTGMTTTELERAIEPFYTTKGDENRSGLGLSMAFGFTKQSGGELALRLMEGGGTAVSLWLPEATATSQAAVAEHRNEIKPRGSGRVLLVEDKAELRVAIQRLVSAMGFSVETAANADAALSLLKTGAPPDLMITDIVMPGSLNGKELADIAVAQQPELRVLLMSGYSDLTSDRYAILRKPFSIADLEREISAALRDERAA